MIAASGLQRQRVATGLEEQKPNRYAWRVGQVTCSCGVCKKCRKRESMRRRRAKSVRVLMKPGPRIDDTRRCRGCEGPIAVTNKTGFCEECHHTHRARRVGHVAQRRQWFSHGGGI